MFANLSVLAMNFALQGQWDLRAMWGTMGVIAKGVVIILFLLSAWSLGVMIDRALMYSAARKQSRVFVQQVAGALREGKLDEAISIASATRRAISPRLSPRAWPNFNRLPLKFPRARSLRLPSAVWTVPSPSSTPT